MNDKRLAELRSIAAKKRKEHVIHIWMGLISACGATNGTRFRYPEYMILKERGLMKCCDRCHELYQALSQEERIAIECP